MPAALSPLPEHLAHAPDGSDSSNLLDESDGDSDGDSAAENDENLSELLSAGTACITGALALPAHGPAPLQDSPTFRALGADHGGAWGGFQTAGVADGKCGGAWSGLFTGMPRCALLDLTSPVRGCCCVQD